MVNGEQNPEATPERVSKGGGLGKAVIAAILSLLVPGLGQVYNRQVRKGYCFCGLSWAITLTAIVGRLAHTLAGFVVFVGLTIGFVIYCAVDAFLFRKRDGIGPREGKWWAQWKFGMAVLLGIQLSYSVFFDPNELLRAKANVIPSEAMTPTLQVGDRIISDPTFWTRNQPKRGDLGLFDMPTPLGEGNAVAIKRIIAVGGDRVSIVDGQLLLNDSPLEEPYLEKPGEGKQVHEERKFGPVEVRMGEYFVLGDNRINSADSRHFGNIKRERLRGRPMYIYWSKDWGRVGRELK